MNADFFELQSSMKANEEEMVDAEKYKMGAVLFILNVRT